MLHRLLAFAWLLAALVLVPARAQALGEGEAVLLVARPELLDPNFAETVVLVVFPPGGGPTGVILNRPTQLQWKDAFPGERELEQRTDPIYFGGPVQLRVLWYLFHRAQAPETALPVVDDLYLSADGKLLDRVLAGEGEVERFFVGYAGWSPAQLEMEIAQGAWYVLPADAQSIFGLEPRTMWRELLRRATAIRT